jgi:hypothetical protein
VLLEDGGEVDVADRVAARHQDEVGPQQTFRILGPMLGLIFLPVLTASGKKEMF